MNLPKRKIFYDPDNLRQAKVTVIMGSRGSGKVYFFNKLLEEKSKDQNHKIVVVRKDRTK